MTKADLITAIAEKTGIEKVAVTSVVDQFMKQVNSSLKQGNSVYLRGFGTFEVRTRKEKKGQNIKRGGTVIIPASKVVKFKQAPAVAKAVGKLPV